MKHAGRKRRWRRAPLSLVERLPRRSNHPAWLCAQARIRQVVPRTHVRCSELCDASTALDSSFRSRELKKCFWSKTVGLKQTSGQQVHARPCSRASRSYGTAPAIAVGSPRRHRVSEKTVGETGSQSSASCSPSSTPSSGTKNRGNPLDAQDSRSPRARRRRREVSLWPTDLSRPRPRTPVVAARRLQSGQHGCRHVAAGLG